MAGVLGLYSWKDFKFELFILLHFRRSTIAEEGYNYKVQTHVHFSEASRKELFLEFGKPKFYVYIPYVSNKTCSLLAGFSKNAAYPFFISISVWIIRGEDTKENAVIYSLYRNRSHFGVDFTLIRNYWYVFISLFIIIKLFLIRAIIIISQVQKFP